MELGKLSRYGKEIGLPDKRFVYLGESRVETGFREVELARRNHV
jgi:hypothetical protein